MDLFSDFIAAVQSDMTVTGDSTLFPVAQVQLALNRAYNKAGGLYLWPATEDSKKTSSKNGYEYYDYPQTWRPQTIWKLRVDGVDYADPLVFKDYLFEKDNNFPSHLKYMWANQSQRIFIYPTPTTDGNNNIEMWGQKSVTPLVSNSDTTIFSYAMREGNEAVVLEAVRILKMKGEDIQQTVIPRVGEMRDLEAKEILTRLWAKIAEGQMKYKKQEPQFDVPNFFGRQPLKRTGTPGDFDF